MTARVAVAVSLCVALAGVARVATTQESGRVHRIGNVGGGSRQQSEPYRRALEEGLRNLGYEKGRNIAFEYRDADGRPGRYPDLFAELIRSRVDVIVSGSNINAAAAKRATSTTPIVMTAASDPVGSGLVASLARPGGNVTGLSADVTPQISAKRLQLLKEVAPTISRVAVLWDSAFANQSEYMKALSAAAPTLGVVLHPVEVRAAADLDAAFAAILKARPDALFVFLNSLTLIQRQPIVDFAARLRVPAVYGNRAHVEVGGLLAYGVDLPDLYRRAAVFVDKVLKGAAPGELPIEQPTKFELVVNLRTARTLGLAVPSAVLLRADEVME